MSKARTITKQELAAIKLSVVAARERFSIKPGPYSIVEHLKSFRADRVWRFPQDDPYMQALRAISPDATHAEFAKSLRKLLAVRGPSARPQPTLDNLDTFLLDHWADAKEGLPELFYLTPKALLRLCQRRLNRPQLTEAALTKSRQRLGLKAFKRQKRDAVWIGGRWTFPQVDKSR